MTLGHTWPERPAVELSPFMLPDDSLAALTYEDLVSRLLELRDEIDALQEMTGEEEQMLRQTYAAVGETPPEDLRDHLIVQAGRRQVTIVRECLCRVDLGKLAEDTGYPETSLMLFASYRGDPPDPTAN